MLQTNMKLFLAILLFSLSAFCIELTSVTLTGNSEIECGESAVYQGVAVFDDGSRLVINSLPDSNWGFLNETTYATVNERGIVQNCNTVPETSEIQVYVVLMCSYSFGGITKSATLSIHLQNATKSLNAITINGKETLERNFNAYECMATFSDGTHKIVSPVWQIVYGSAYAKLGEGGFLHNRNYTGNNKTLMLSAKYTFLGVTINATKSILVQALSNPELISIGIIGDTSIGTNATAVYKCYASFKGVDDAEVISPEWSVTEGEEYVRIAVSKDAVTLYNRNPDHGEKQIKLSASYTYNGTKREDTFEVLLAGTTGVIKKLEIICGHDKFACREEFLCTCNATFSDGSTEEIKPKWSIASGAQYAEITEDGILKNKNMTNTSQFVTVRASYQGTTAEKKFTMQKYEEKQLSFLTIEGAMLVPYDSTVQFICVATFSDGSIEAVSPEWSQTEGKDYAFFNTMTGELTCTNSTQKLQNTRINAKYTKGLITKSATLQVALVNKDNPPISLSISGEYSVPYMLTEGYSCTLKHKDGTSFLVKPQWSIAENQFSDAIISEDGILLNMNTSGYDHAIILQALFIANETELKAYFQVTLRHNARTLIALSIEGENLMEALSYSSYECTAGFSDGTLEKVTPKWYFRDEDVNFATVAQDGTVFNKNSSPTGKNVTLTAEFEYDNHIIKETKSIYMNGIDRTIDNLFVIGNTLLANNETTQYYCQVLYSDGTTENVTPVWSIEEEAQTYALFSVEGNKCSITNINATLEEKRIPLSAMYTYNGTTIISSAEIILMPVSMLIEIVGDTQINYEETKEYGCYIFEKAGEEPVLAKENVTWQLTSVPEVVPPVATLTQDESRPGIMLLKNANTLENDVTYCISACYTGEIATLSSSITVTVSCPKKRLTSIEIIGDEIIAQNDSEMYICQAEFSDGTVELVTPQWSLEGAVEYVDVTYNAGGDICSLQNKNTTGDPQHVILSAKYGHAGIEFEKSHSIYTENAPIGPTWIYTQLRKGWNYISIPFDIDEDSWKKLSDAVVCSWKWDAQFQHYAKLTAKPTSGQGLALFCTDDMEPFKLAGTPWEGSFNTHIGWNLFGKIITDSEEVMPFANLPLFLLQDGAIIQKNAEDTTFGAAYWFFYKLNAE